MKNIGVYHGATLLDKDDFQEDNHKKMELEYYEVKKRSIDKVKLKTFYGITIVKKEYGREQIKYEKNSIQKICTNERKIVNIIEVLKTNKVTPIQLNDVIADLMKQPAFQEN